jgi:hypothetical protein
MFCWPCIVIYLYNRTNMMNYFHSLALQPSAGYGLLVHEVSWSHTTTRHSRKDSSGRVISSSQRPVPDNTQHTQQTNIHAPGGTRTYDRSRRADVDQILKPRGHWDRLMHCLLSVFFSINSLYLRISVVQWLRHCATNRKFAGSIPDGVRIFHWHNPSGRTMALGSTQPLTEMSARNVSWG